MVRVMPRVLDGDIPEKTAVRPQDVVRLGPHLPSVLKYPPRPPIPTPPDLLRQEVFRHVLETLRCKRRCDIFRSFVPLRCSEVYIEVPRHQQFRL